MANSVYDQLPETPCMFKPLGISRHQQTARLLRKDELVKLVAEDEKIAIYNLAFQKLGEVPPYLESILMPYIDAAPDGFYYARVKSVSGKMTIGVWLVLLESPTLPEFLTSEKTEMSIWYGRVSGVTFENRQKWWKKIEESTLLDGLYPHVAMQKEDANPADSNALKILAYFSIEGWQHIGYVSREDARDIRFASKSEMRFYTRLISVGEAKNGNIGGTVEIVGMSSEANGFEALA